MPLLKYAKILADLEGLDAWLQTLGLEPKNDRVHNAIEILREAEAISTGEKPRPESSERFIFPLTEALEIHDIFLALRDSDPTVLKEKVPRAFSGPHRAMDETSTTADGRNVMFELYLAADMKLRGLPAQIGDPDVFLDIRPGFFIECKRPQKDSSIRANIRDAADQLDETLRNADGKWGVIAVSVSRILNRGDKLFVASSLESGTEQLGNLLEAVARENQRYWGKLDTNRRICAVLFHAATPAIFRDRNTIFQLSYVQVFATGLETGELKILQHAITQAYQLQR